MSTERIIGRYEPGRLERIQFAITTLIAILRNKPIIVCIGEGTIYARTNWNHMQHFAHMMAEACVTYDLDALEDRIRRTLTEIPDERKN